MFAVGYVHGAQVTSQFLGSMLALARQPPGTPVETFLAAPSGPNISEARNLLVRRFLDECRSPWLLMVDTDMVFTPAAVQRLVKAADPDLRPVIGALCYSQDENGGDPHPTMYEFVETPDGQQAFARYRVWQEGVPFPVAATGAAFLLMHRRALEKVEALGDVAAPWFREAVLGGALAGEDMTFCIRCAVASVPVHVHTGVQVGHVKPVMLGKVT